MLFHPTFEWGYRLSESSSLSIFYEHISNANTAAKNEGLDSWGSATATGFDQRRAAEMGTHGALRAWDDWGQTR